MPDSIALLDKLIIALERLGAWAYSLSLLWFCGVQPPVLNPLRVLECLHHLATLDSLMDGVLVVSVLLSTYTFICAHLRGLMAKLGVVGGH